MPLEFVLQIMIVVPKQVRNLESHLNHSSHMYICPTVSMSGSIGGKRPPGRPPKRKRRLVPSGTAAASDSSLSTPTTGHGSTGRESGPSTDPGSGPPSVPSSQGPSRPGSQPPAQRLQPLVNPAVAAATQLRALSRVGFSGVRALATARVAHRRGTSSSGSGSDKAKSSARPIKTYPRLLPIDRASTAGTSVWHAHRVNESTHFVWKAFDSLVCCGFLTIYYQL